MPGGGPPRLGEGLALPESVLIVGINYWPETTGIAPYTTGLAEGLTQRGVQVSALTGMPYYPEWRIAGAYRGNWRRRERHRGVRIMRVRQYVPNRQTALRRAAFEASYVAGGLMPVGVRRPAAIVGVIPNLGGGLLAAMLARRYQTPFGLICQDLVGQAAAQSGLPGGGRVAGVTRALEGWIARRAASVAVIADSFRPYLRSLGVPDERIVTVPNWSHVASGAVDRAAVRQRMGWRSEDHVVLHAGNMGAKQALEHVVAAARHAQITQPHVRFVLLGHGNQRLQLEQLAAGLTNVDFVDPLPEPAFLETLAAADVLLVHERASVRDMSLPSKLTSYFTVGRPVVAAVPSGGATDREMARSGAGLVTPPEDPAALLAALERLRSDEQLSASMAEAGPRYARQHLSERDGVERAIRFVASIPRGRGGSSPAHDRANRKQHP